MTRYLTQDCDCPDVITGTGGRRPTECSCGNRYLTEAQLNPPERKPLRRVSPKRELEEASGQRPRVRSTLRRTEPKRDWSLAQTKKEEEGCCRICKRSDRPLENAHILGREYDEPKIGADGRPLKELWVDPDRVIPACGPFPDGCHGDIDLHRINYMGHLTLSEQVRAVEDAGGIAQAYRALMPVERREEVERSAAVA